MLICVRVPAFHVLACGNLGCKLSHSSSNSLYQGTIVACAVLFNFCCSICSSALGILALPCTVLSNILQGTIACMVESDKCPERMHTGHGKTELAEVC